MDPVQYFVLLEGAGWQIWSEGHLYGPYLSRTEAVLAARTAAKETVTFGFPSQVLVRDYGKPDFRTQWTFAAEPQRVAV